MSRVLSGGVLAAVFFAILWFANATVLLIVALGVCVLAFQEFARVMQQIGADPPRLPALLMTLATLASVPFPYVAVEAVIAIGLLVVAVSVMLRLASTSRSALQPRVTADGDEVDGRHAIHAAAAGTLSMIYLGLPLGALVGVHIFGGRGAVTLLVATVAISDTAQYYVGRLAGRHRLAPRLSPNKTIEGAMGGFVVAPTFLYFAGPQLVPVADPVTSAAIGVAVVAAGIAGDLFESMLKRAAKMKDSSTIIPGHGGILDRIDALLFATPVFYLYLRWQYAG